MRSQYVKPVVFFEGFSLTQTIARNCGSNTHQSTLGTPTYYSEVNCGWDTGGWIVFLEGNEACVDDQLEEFEDFVAECYNNPDGGVEVFSSL